MTNDPKNKQGMGEHHDTRQGDQGHKSGQPNNPDKQHTLNPGGQRQQGEERRDPNQQHKGGQR